MNKMYAVKMSTGKLEDYYSWIQFVTANKDYADKYVEKFNAMLIKWNQYFNQFKDQFGWIDQKYYDTWIHDRYTQIKEFNRALVDEVEVR